MRILSERVGSGNTANDLTLKNRWCSVGRCHRLESFSKQVSRAGQRRHNKKEGPVESEPSLLSVTRRMGSRGGLTSSSLHRHDVRSCHVNVKSIVDIS
jgi:hypothetical protein